MTSTSSAHLICLCGAISEPGSLLADPEVPLSTDLCHCNPCRLTTGTLGVSWPPLSSSPSQDTLSKLTAYHSSANSTRYFCFKCGCHCFLHDRQTQEWECLSGIIEPSPEFKDTKAPWPKDTIKVSRHDYVLDTLDGGLAPCLLNLNGRTIPTWAAGHPRSQQDSFDLPHATILSLPAKSTSTLPPPEPDAYLPAKCHCGGVSLLIKRANYPAKTSPGYVSARHIPPNPTKYLTFLCACRSCRVATGVSLVPWTSVPPVNIFNAHDPHNTDSYLIPLSVGHATSDKDSNPGQTLKHYWSSKDVCWSFCSRCGATVLYWNARRPEEADMATGVFRAEEGCMARRWLDWDWGRCGFVEEAVDREVTEAWVEYGEDREEIG